MVFKRIIATLVLMFVVAIVNAAEKFETQPEEAPVALRVTRGKPFSSGYVFINGKYIKPPYVVERYGTVIRINGIQVTKPIVPWKSFLETQNESVKVEKEVVEEEKPNTPEPKEEPQAKDDDDDDDDIDDLFSTGKKAKPRVKARPKVVATPKNNNVKKPSPQIKVNFVANEKSKALLARINEIRIRIDKNLRNGGYYCFGTRYSPIVGDATLTKKVLSKLPEIMRKNSEKDAFRAAMRNGGFGYLPVAVLDDFFANRFDYFTLSARIKEDEEKKKWQTLLE